MALQRERVHQGQDCSLCRRSQTSQGEAALKNPLSGRDKLEQKYELKMFFLSFVTCIRG